MVDVRSGIMKNRISSSLASKRHGCTLPPDGARRAGVNDHLDWVITFKRWVLRRWREEVGFGFEVDSTGPRLSRISSTSKRTRPDGSSPPRPIRRTAAATVAAPSVISLRVGASP